MFTINCSAAMAMYPREHWEGEFARLALRELDNPDGIYDASQALMALLALVVVINERDLLQRAPDLTRKTMIQRHWPVDNWSWNHKWSPEEVEAGKRSDGLHAFIRQLRHALAHGQFEFLGDETTLNGITVEAKTGENFIRGMWVGFQIRFAATRLAELLQTEQ